MHAGIHPGRTIAAVAVEQPAGAAGLPRRGCVRTIANQRATQQRLGRRIDRAQQRLLDVVSLSGRVCATSPPKRLHEFGVKRRCPSAQCLELLTLGGEQRRNRRRHLIASSRQQPRRPGRRHRIRHTHTRPDPRQIHRRRRQHIRPNHNK